MNKTLEILPDVTVIVPVFGRASTLPAAILSALSDGRSITTEVIVVDDCSPGSLDDIVKPFPVRFVRLAENGGSSAARNVGIGLAEGRYLKFLDSDDVLHLDSTIQEVACADRTGADIVVAGWREVVRQQCGSLGVIKDRRAPEFRSIPDDLLRGAGVPTSAALYRREAMQGIFWRKPEAMNDWDFFVRCALRSRFIERCESVAYDWVQHDGNRITSNLTVEQNVSAFYGVLATIIEDLASRGMLNDSRRGRAAQYLYKELRRLWVLDPTKAREVLRWIKELDDRFVPIVEEPSRLFRLAGRVGVLRPSLEIYAVVKRMLSG